MAKRFTDTELWKQDWFLDMPPEYKLFYFYVKDGCDHAGIFKVNLRTFCLLNGVKIDTAEALKYFNKDKERILVLKDDRWFLVDFFVFQYGYKLNLNNPLHRSIKELLDVNEVTLGSVRGLKEVLERTKSGEAYPQG